MSKSRVGVSPLFSSECQSKMNLELNQQPEMDIRTIEITFKRISGLRPVYQFPLMSLRVEFVGECLLETEELPFDKTQEINHTVVLDLDYLDHTSYDKFISCPIVLVITETEGPGDVTLELPEPAGKAVWRSDDSVLDLEEALFGTRTDEVAKEGIKVGSKNSSKGSTRDSSGDKLGKSSKGSSKTEKGFKSKLQTAGLGAASETTPVGPQTAGIGVLDLLPLFLGKSVMEESIVLRADTGNRLDDTMTSVASLPRIEIEVTIDKPIPVGNIYNMTVESIYNIPSLISEDMKVRLVVNVPTVAKHVSFNDYTYATEPHKMFSRKKWHATNLDSKYYMEHSFENVKGDFKETSMEVLSIEVPRLEYNVLKRSYGGAEDMEALRQHLRMYKSLAVEVYVQATEGEAQVQKGRKTSKEVGKKGKPLSVIGNEKEEPEYLHMLAQLNLGRLLYPGQKSVRLATQLQTFNIDEAEACCGLKDSYFRPKPPRNPPQEAEQEEPKAGKGKNDKESKASKSSKGSKREKGAPANLQGKLPQPPVPSEPSKLVFSEDGLPCVLVFQFDLEEPLVKVTQMEDLTEELHTILSSNPQLTQLPKTVKSSKVTEQLYKDTIRSLARDMKCQYLDFMKEIEVSNERIHQEKHFLAYLQHKGVYQTYLSTLTRATAVYVNSTYQFDLHSPNFDYYPFISAVYVQLVEKMNTEINELFKVGKDIVELVSSSNEQLLRYAHEAMELGATTLASRYLLQRIYDDETNANYWFDYAIYNMHIGKKEKAYECACMALKHQPMHRNSLVLYALMLAQNNKFAEAETCLLNITLHNPTWVEGWGALYCIYMHSNNVEGMDVALDIAKKNLDLCKPQSINDLVWSTAMVPNTVFYRFTCYFISMRLYAEAEMMLSSEVLQSRQGINEYLLAVISYYRKDYEHALLHVDNALYYGGCDYTKNSLRGHIVAVQGDPFCALEEYKVIFQQFRKPDEVNMYLVYVQSGLCYSSLGDDQKSRQSFLKACKIEGSPFTWLCAGILYLHQRDFLSAEECLTQANSLDNLLPEAWVYLALVNVKLRRGHEAQMCLHQAELHKLENEKLLNFARKEVNDLTDSRDEEQ